MVDRESESEASTKVQEVAASMQQAAATRKRISGSKAEGVAKRYFAAIDERDLESALALWAEGGRENVRGQVDVLAPEGVREFIGGLLDAVPDLKMEVVSTTSEGERCGVQWRLTRHLRRARRLRRRRADGQPDRARGLRPAVRPRRPDPEQRRVQRQHDVRAPASA